MIIVLEGIDGAGKSALAPVLCAALQAHDPTTQWLNKSGVVEETDSVAAGHLEALRRLIWKNDEPLADPFEPGHWIHLLAAWYHALEWRVLRPARAEGRTLLLDGWFTRNIVKTAIRMDSDPQLIQVLFDAIPRPDVTILLDTDPETAWSRSGSLKPSELGRWDGFEADPHDSFVNYQSRIRAGLIEIAAREGWLIEKSSATDTPLSTAARVEQALLAKGLFSL